MPAQGKTLNQDVAAIRFIGRVKTHKVPPRQSNRISHKNELKLVLLKGLRVETIEDCLKTNDQTGDSHAEKKLLLKTTKKELDQFGIFHTK